MARLEAAEMRFLRSVKGYTRLGKIRSEVIRKELKTSGIQDVKSKYKQNWINHLERMDNTRLPKHALNYKPRGEMRSWTPQEKMATRRCRNSSNDLIHGGIWWWWFFNEKYVVWGGSAISENLCFRQNFITEKNLDGEWTKVHDNGIISVWIFFRRNMWNSTFMWPCIVTNFFLIKPTDAPISQIYFVKKLSMFGTFPLPIIKSFPLYIRHWYMSCKFDDSSQARLVVLESCHQTCMTYTSAECTVENSWWWAEELPKTCRVSW